MNIRFPFSIALLALAALLLAAGRGRGATLSVSPSTVSNTYNGFITLTVAGLNAGETVVIQKFADGNTNGVLDATDVLVQQFSLTDGAATVIGGVTNLNVPGDTDSTSTQITAKLNFQAGDISQNVIGQYLYKLSRSTGPVATNLFSITNAAYAQKITGNIVNSGTNVPYASVILFPAPRKSGDLGNPVAGTVANSTGGYTIQIPPGTYVPLAFKSNYVANYTTSPVLTLSNSQTITTNLTLTNATASISGKVVDAVSNSIVLPGLFVPARGTNGAGNYLIAAGSSDTNGNFTIRVTSGMWGLSGDPGGLSVHGYVAYDNGTNVAAGTSGFVGVFYKATALFYGTVKDSLGNPLPGVAIEARDNNNNIYDTDGYSDVNGNYFAIAVGGLGDSDPWQVDVDHSSSFPNYNFSSPALNQNGGTNLTTGLVVRQNFTAIFASNYITGHVKFNSQPVTNAEVDAYSDDTNNYQAQAYTDTNGNYSLTVAAGSWNVSPNCQGGDNSLDGLLGGGTYQCPSGESIGISNNNATNDFIIQSAGYGPYQITGQVTDTTDNPIAGVNVYASDGNANFFTATTDDGGNYSLNNVNNVNVTVSLDCSGLASLGYACAGSQGVSGVNISNYNASGLDFIVPINQPALGSPAKHSSTQFQFYLSGNSNQNYTVQYSTNLGAGNWTALFVTNNALTNSFLVTDPAATNRQRFYRILIGP